MILKNGLVMDETFSLRACDLQFENGTITRLGENLTGDDTLDMHGHYVLPGFIDSHMHGAMGCKLSDTDPLPDLEKITQYEATQGVTTIALGSTCSDFDHLLRQFDLAVEAAQHAKGAKIAALHAEGPFINPSRKGAMDERFILSPSISQLDQLIAHGKGLLRLVTLAPEMAGSMEVIAYAVQQGLTVSMGHTDATYAQAMAAIAAGATQSTHTFNAMRALNHREPGILGAALTDPRVTCEMICDHTHLHPAILKLIYQIKGADKINIVSDSEHGAGIETDQIVVDGEVRYIRDGVMLLQNGTIAGSASSMLRGVRNLLADGIPLADVSRMASANPARTLKIDHLTGSIAVGKAADLVVLSPDYHVLRTYVNGVCAYTKGA